MLLFCVAVIFRQYEQVGQYLAAYCGTTYQLHWKYGDDNRHWLSWRCLCMLGTAHGYVYTSFPEICGMVHMTLASGVF